MDQCRLCTLACFGSLSQGAKLIARTSPEVIRGLTRDQPAAEPNPQPAAKPGKPLLVKPKLSSVASQAARVTASITGERRE